MAKRRTYKHDLVLKGRDGSVWAIDVKIKPGSGVSEMEFCEMLRQAIQESGVSQYHLSQAAGVPQGAISVFLGGGDLRVTTFTRLAHVMGLELRRNRAKAPKKIKPPVKRSKRKT
jgi:hypothetical protein